MISFSIGLSVPNKCIGFAESILGFVEMSLGLDLKNNLVLVNRVSISILRPVILSLVQINLSL